MKAKIFFPVPGRSALQIGKVSTDKKKKKDPPVLLYNLYSPGNRQRYSYLPPCFYFNSSRYDESLATQEQLIWNHCSRCKLSGFNTAFFFILLSFKKRNTNK